MDWSKLNMVTDVITELSELISVVLRFLYKEFSVEIFCIMFRKMFRIFITVVFTNHSLPLR